MSSAGWLRCVLVAAAVSAALFGSPGIARAQGIDCFKAPNGVQRTICTDSDLIALDVKMASLYRDAVKHATPAQEQALATEQQRWAAGTRDACDRQKDVKGCVTEAYRAHNAQLTSYASGESKLPAGATPSLSTSSSPSTSTAKKLPSAPKIAATGTHVYTCQRPELAQGDLHKDRQGARAVRLGGLDVAAREERQRRAVQERRDIGVEQGNRAALRTRRQEAHVQ